ncbi:Uu.00g022550.m01.CDS01 [Anthostomella pinea]|uniref:Uu.00g022550.m01.CDS01 n=1 Tax=Anthostomella pinea TaxID=933095 RepID=A0AAI8YR20_9PEZI|nr:Uu.00g022550.m01.CDS01 [Anthostomella pinea]
MPISRKKACHQCRAAKARCSLDAICLRCLERGIECNYAGAATRVSPYSRPAGDPSQRVGRTASAVISEVLPSVYGPELDVDFLGTPTEPQHVSVAAHAPSLDTDMGAEVTAFRLSDLTNESTPDKSDAQWVNSNGWFQPPATELSIQRRNSLQVEQSPARPENSPRMDYNWTSWISAFVDDARENHMTLQRPDVESRGGLASPNGGAPYTFRKRTTVVYGRPYESLLSQRKPESTETFLTTRILLGQFASYPKMLIQGTKLPPFIYPRCVLDDRLPHACVAGGTHQCLPEPLANCASLVHLFHGRQQGNRQFVWNAIYAEIRRLNGEFQSYDQETVMASIQAMVIYMLLQSQDAESMENNDIASLIESVSEFSMKLHFATNYRQDVYKFPDLNHRNWVFYESLRRTTSLLFMIEMILVVLIGDPNIPGCGTILGTPLPCARDLWDSDTTESGAARLHRYVRDRKSDRVLKVDDLMRRGSGEIEDNVALVDDLATWCDGLDEFGTLVWMASGLNRARLGAL